MQEEERDDDDDDDDGECGDCGDCGACGDHDVRIVMGRMPTHSLVLARPPKGLSKSNSSLSILSKYFQKQIYKLSDLNLFIATYKRLFGQGKPSHSFTAAARPLASRWSPPGLASHTLPRVSK